MVSNRAFRNGASILNIGIATFIEDNVYTFMMDTNLLDQLYRILSGGRGGKLHTGFIVQIFSLGGVETQNTF